MFSYVFFFDTAHYTLACGVGRKSTHQKSTGFAKVEAGLNPHGIQHRR